MESFVMEIAGLAVQVNPMFQSTREYCRPYLIQRDPEYIVRVMSEDLAYEQLMLDREAVEEGLKLRKFKEPFLERATIQRKVAEELLRHNILMLHGSTVAVDGQAYLFTAACGTGKSTHTRLWRELLGERAIMVNDDKPFLKITSDSVLAYGSPWSGKHGLASNVCVPLKGICLLHRGKENTIRPVEPAYLLDALHHQAYIPGNKALSEKASALVVDLANLVPLWEMDCTKEPEAAMVSYSAMSGKK